MKSRGPFSDRSEGGALNRKPLAHASSPLKPHFPYSWFKFIRLVPRDPGSDETTSGAETVYQADPPWRQDRGKLMVSLVNSHTNATRIGWHLWEIDSRFAPGLPPGWVCPGSTQEVSNFVMPPPQISKQTSRKGFAEGGHHVVCTLQIVQRVRSGVAFLKLTS